MTSDRSMLFSYYGDDFTGSTDVMWALAERGVRTVLFLGAPDADFEARFKGVRAVGIAGVARSLPTRKMAEELLPALRWMKSTGSLFAHYKVCSTFDSSPVVGSIGRAIELGRDVFGVGPVPVIVASPALGRYQAFGNLFARSGLDSPAYRLDRHPTMSRHPSTPMDESDLRLHLARQTGLSIGLVDVTQLDRLPGLDPNEEIVLFDVMTEEHLRRIGAVLTSEAGRRGSLFVVGSSGVESAILAYWASEHSGEVGPSLLKEAAPTDRLLVVSGSCSPVTAGQIEWAADRGFAEIALATEKIVGNDDGEAQREQERAVCEARRHLVGGRSVIVHACKGPGDPRIAATREVARRTDSGGDGDGAAIARRIGKGLAQIALGVLRRETIQRVIVTGGDNSGYVARELGIDALEAVSPLAPGAPLCRAYATGPIDGLEIAFKGGQVGTREFFGIAHDGRI